MDAASEASTIIFVNAAEPPVAEELQPPLLPASPEQQEEALPPQGPRKTESQAETDLASAPQDPSRLPHRLGCRRGTSCRAGRGSPS